MGMVRVAAFAAIAVVIGGTGYLYRGEIARQLGMGTSAKAAEQAQGSPAAQAQPQGRRGRLNPGGAVPVVVATAERKAMPVVVDAVGTVQAITSIQIKPRIDSQIMKVNVEEGALVKEGDVLFELDSRTLRAQLGQIEAQIRKAQAQLVQNKRDQQRFEELLAKNA
ncbi:MAG: biotin/lipoyl-binding protein, partial [Reyranella sp.]